MKFSKEPCPVCGSNSLTELNDHVYKFKHGRKLHIVDGLSHSRCQECGVSMFLPEQMKLNNLKVKEYQSKLSDYISPEQVLTLRETYNLTQAQANTVFGGGPTAFSKYERGESSPSAGAARQMLAALRDPEYMRTLCQHHGIQINQASKAESSAAKFVRDLSDEMRDKIYSTAAKKGLSLDVFCVELVSTGLDVIIGSAKNTSVRVVEQIIPYSKIEVPFHHAINQHRGYVKHDVAVNSFSEPVTLLAAMKSRIDPIKVRMRNRKI